VNTLAMTKPEKAQMVENHLCQMARSGQLMNKVGGQWQIQAEGNAFMAGLF